MHCSLTLFHHNHPALFHFYILCPYFKSNVERNFAQSSLWLFYQRCLKKRGEGSVLRRRGLLCYGCGVLCSVIERISKAGWLLNSLRKPDGKPSDSPWQLLPLCHKQNTRRLSLLPTPTGFGRCQTEQSLSQPPLLSNTLSLPLSLFLCLLQYKQKRSTEALPL